MIISIVGTGDLGVLEEIGPKITVGTRGYRTIEPTEPQRPQNHRAEQVE